MSRDTTLVDGEPRNSSHDLAVVDGEPRNSSHDRTVVDARQHDPLANSGRISSSRDRTVVDARQHDPVAADGPRGTGQDLALSDVHQSVPAPDGRVGDGAIGPYRAIRDVPKDDRTTRRATLRSDRLGSLVVNLVVVLLAAVTRVLGRHAPRTTAGSRATTWLLKRPRLVLGAGVLLGLAIVTASAHTWWTSPSTEAPICSAAASAMPASLVSAHFGVDGSNPLAVIAAYNAASIAAAASGDRTLMEPYLAPDSPVRAAITAEYARRQRSGERHHAALVRWGIVDQEQAEHTARVVTQEAWDDVVVVAGSVVEETRGSLVRVSYHLERTTATGSWRISSVSSQEIVP